MNELTRARAEHEEVSGDVKDAIKGLQRIVDGLAGVPSQIPLLPLAEETLLEVTCQCGNRLEWVQEVSRWRFCVMPNPATRSLHRARVLGHCHMPNHPELNGHQCGLAV